MKRRLALLASLSLVLSIALPAGAAPESSTYALQGEARGLELGLGDQGLTLGVAFSRATSAPFAKGIGAGQCAILGEEDDPSELPCTDNTSQESSAPGGKNTEGQRCAGPAVPDPLGSILTFDLACGSSTSIIRKEGPSTFNEGKISEVALELDLRGLIPQAEDAKEQLVDRLQDVLGGSPEPIKNALNQLLDVIDEGQAAQVLLGPANSNIAPIGDKVTVTSTASGARIGVAGIPDLDKDGVPIPGSSEATEDGLVIVEVGAARASATIDKISAAGAAAATAALVTVKVRDITKVEPTYQQVSVAPGQTVTILQGTPAESTITAAAATSEEKPGSAIAAADAVRLHLLKGVQGGIKLGLARATAAASAEAPPGSALVNKPDPDTKVLPKVLPRTGARDVTTVALGLLLLALVGIIVRRRVS